MLTCHPLRISAEMRMTSSQPRCARGGLHLERKLASQIGPRPSCTGLKSVKAGAQAPQGLLSLLLQSKNISNFPLRFELDSVAAFVTSKKSWAPGQAAKIWTNDVLFFKGDVLGFSLQVRMLGAFNFAQMLQGVLCQQYAYCQSASLFFFGWPKTFVTTDDSHLHTCSTSFLCVRVVLAQDRRPAFLQPVQF